MRAAARKQIYVVASPLRGHQARTVEVSDAPFVKCATI